MAAVRTKLLRYPSKIAPAKPPLAATLGNFDGIHLGHQRLLAQVQSYKSAHPEVKTALISFYPHPALVLGKAEKLPAITSPSQMAGILGLAGIDYFYLIHFTREFSRGSAEDFVSDLLIDHLNVRYLAIGEDARVGAGGRGDSKFIQNTFKSGGRTAEIIGAVEAEGARISSRRVRAAILEGEMEAVRKLTGRFFGLMGRVVGGEKRGSALGYPTANLHIKRKTLLPRHGVYATRVTMKGKAYSAVTNAGERPTFDKACSAVESYLLDYKGEDFYGSKISVDFIKFLRPEKRFAGADELKAQIARDIQEASKFCKRSRGINA